MVESLGGALRGSQGGGGKYSDQAADSGGAWEIRDSWRPPNAEESRLSRAASEGGRSGLWKITRRGSAQADSAEWRCLRSKRLALYGPYYGVPLARQLNGSDSATSARARTSVLHHHCHRATREQPPPRHCVITTCVLCRRQRAETGFGLATAAAAGASTRDF